MKANKFFAVVLAALSLVACDKKGQDVDPTITLNKTQIELAAVGATETLVATVTPEGTAVVWSSMNDKVASVANGLVVATGEGQTVVIATAGKATASCIVKVGKGGGEEVDFSKLLTGTDYYVLALDEASFSKIEKNVKGDFRINGEYVGETIPAETTSVLQIWGNTLTGGDGGGLNCFGLVDGYLSLKQQDGEWSGNGCGGIFQTHRSIDMTGVTEDHVLAIAYKCPANNPKGAKVQFTLYSTTVDNKPEVPFKMDANTDGEWALFEVSMKDVFAKGLDWSKAKDCTTEGWHSLGLLIEPSGSFAVDAALIYKK